MSERPRPIHATPAGVDFQVHFCLNCERDGGFMEGGYERGAEGCRLAARGVAFDPGDDQYPDAFTETDAGWTCMAFVPKGKDVPTDAELEAEGQLTIGDLG